MCSKQTNPVCCLLTVQSGRAELNAMLREMWSAPEVPVLVLSCVKEYSTKRVPAIDIVKHLQLGRQNRPWQVCILFVRLTYIYKVCILPFIQQLFSLFCPHCITFLDKNNVSNIFAGPRLCCGFIGRTAASLPVGRRTSSTQMR